MLRYCVGGMPTTKHEVSQARALMRRHSEVFRPNQEYATAGLARKQLVARRAIRTGKLMSLKHGVQNSFP